MCKPFLRWVGGKNWLLKYFPNIIGDVKYNNYHELFLGGGSTFFHLNPQGQSYLADSNSDLINTYKQVRDNVESVIEHLKKHKNTKDYYYYVRDEFNPYSDVGKAAKFIYLNQTSFNGIYRVNLKGKYNVPYGFRRKKFLDRNCLYQASELLQETYLQSGDFTENLDCIQKYDLVFLDPPYTITHNNNGFFKYNEKLFSKDDQYRLSSFIDCLKDKGAFYILTNAAHKEVETIFDKGDRLIKLQRASLIGGKNAIRERYSEVIFTNLPL